MKKVVTHISEVFDWESKQPKEPKTLILGSFNPFNPHSELVTDFYYGRIPKRGRGNRFWTTIGNLKYKDSNYFKENVSNKYNEMEDSKFMFIDLIKSIEISNEDETLLNQYLKKNVFENYDDSILWKTKTKFQSSTLFVKRNYNEKIINILSESNSIKTVINTLGTTRGDLKFNKRDKEWIRFKEEIFSICQSKNIEFRFDSESPSPLGGSDLEFKSWIVKHVLKV